MKKVFFKYADLNISINNKRRLKLFFESIFDKEKIRLERLDYIFCSDFFLLKLNRSFLTHNYYTDILTFRLSKQKEPVIAEIYISIERVKENAMILNIKFGNELLRVMIHGILHLCNYQDINIKQKKRMTKKEDFYISSFT